MNTTRWLLAADVSRAGITAHGPRKISSMKIATGKVIGGKVVVEGDSFAEGSVVTVVARDDDEPFDVSPEDEKALLAAMVQADRGEVVSWEDLRERLRPVRD